MSDCASLAAAEPGRCEVADTETLLDTVASAPGALGHSEVGAATAQDGVEEVRIDGYPATLEGADEGAYPYWQTEFAYTYGEPPADSMAAGFLRWLADEVGKDVIRSHGTGPARSWPSRCSAARVRAASALGPPHGTGPSTAGVPCASSRTTAAADAGRPASAPRRRPPVLAPFDDPNDRPDAPGTLPRQGDTRRPSAMTASRTVDGRPPVSGERTDA